MKYQDLEDLAKEKKLKIKKRDCGFIYREKGWRGQKWDDTTKASWDNTRIAYKKFRYEARTLDMPDSQAYKITSKDYKKLTEAGAIVEY